MTNNHQPIGTDERGLRPLPSEIAGLLDPELVRALYGEVGAEVPSDLLANAATSVEVPVVGVQTDDRRRAPGIPAAVFTQPVAPIFPGGMAESGTLASAGLVTVTRSIDGRVSASGGSGDRPRSPQNVRRMPRSKAHMALLALRASATGGELEETSGRSPQTSLAGHWLSRTAMEAALATDPNRQWLFIDSNALTITGNSIPSEILSVDELLLFYRLAGRRTMQRSRDLTEPRQSSMDLGSVFSALADRLNTPGHRMLHKKRGSRTRRTDRTGHRWYRLAADVVVNDTNLEKALHAAA